VQEEEEEETDEREGGGEAEQLRPVGRAVCSEMLVPKLIHLVQLVTPVSGLHAVAAVGEVAIDCGCMISD
jgi:hypothetical protein